MRRVAKSKAPVPIPVPAPRQAWKPVVLLVVTLAAYSNSFQSGFPMDNKGLLLEDSRIHEVSAQNLKLIFQHTYWWPHGESGLYRPVTTLSYLFNYAILGNGDHAAGYHWVNLALHFGNVLLLYCLALKLIKSAWPAALLAAVWAVHPALTESVTNIVGRADLLAAMAVLSGLLMYLKSAETAGRRRLAWLGGLGLATAIGVFSKESAVIILPLIALYELAFQRRMRALLWGCAAVLMPLLALAVVRSAIVKAANFPFWDNPLTGAGFWTAKLTAIEVIARYLWIAVWPAKLSCDYSYAQIPLARGGLMDWIAWLAVAAALAGAVAAYWRNRTVFFLAGLALLTLLPTANLLFPIGTIMAERFLYLPLAGLIACAVVGIFNATPRFASALLCAVVAACAARTGARNLDWRDDLTLGQAAVRSSPNSFKSHYLLAQGLYDSDPAHNDLDEVRAEVREIAASMAILDPLPDTRNMAAVYRWAGGAYLLEGDLLRHKGSESESAYRSALAALQRCAAIVDAQRGSLAAGAAAPDVDGWLAAVRLRLHDTAGALEKARTALASDPLNPEAYGVLGDALLASGRADDAAIAIAEGALATLNVGLRMRLLDLYRSGLDTEGCATNGGDALNPRCAMVHRHLCTASAAVVRLREKMGRADLAEQMRSAAKNEFGCEQ